MDKESKITGHPIYEMPSGKLYSPDWKTELKQTINLKVFVTGSTILLIGIPEGAAQLIKKML